VLESFARCDTLEEHIVADMLRDIFQLMATLSPHAQVLRASFELRAPLWNAALKEVDARAWMR
jgi:hypothetical protein